MHLALVAREINCSAYKHQDKPLRAFSYLRRDGLPIMYSLNTANTSNIATRDQTKKLIFFT